MGKRIKKNALVGDRERESRKKRRGPRPAPPRPAQHSLNHADDVLYVERMGGSIKPFSDEREGESAR